MTTREQLIAQWDSMASSTKYSLMYDEYENSRMGTMASEGIMSQAKQDKTIAFYTLMAAKQKFDQLPAGAQEHALRAISSKYALDQNYKERWLPQRGVAYDKYPKKDRIYIGDLVHIMPNFLIIPSSAKSMAQRELMVGSWASKWLQTPLTVMQRYIWEMAKANLLDTILSPRQIDSD